MINIEKKSSDVHPQPQTARFETPTVSVIIVNFNVKEFLEQLLTSLQKSLQNIPSEIIIVDNASSDNSQEFIRTNFPNLTLLENEKNLGFARASNQGLKIARGEYLVLLNPDTIVKEDTFSSMLTFFEQHPEVGMAGCKILNPDGSLQLACRRSFPTPWISFTKLAGLSRLFPHSKLFGKYNLTYLDSDRSYEVDAISGSFMMVRRTALDDVGLLDESFFLYGEDLDWCYRFREAGWKVRYFPDTQIIHFKGESSKRAEFDNLKTFYHAMSLFARKHFRRRYLFMPYWLLHTAIWLRAGIAFIIKFVTSSSFLVPLTDFALLSLSLILGLFVRFGDMQYIDSFVPVIIGYSLIWMVMLKLFGSYDRRKYSVSSAALAVLVGFILNTSLTFFFKQYAFSRAVVLFGGGFALVIVAGWRLLLKFLTQIGIGPFTGTLGKTLLGRKTVIVGDLDSGAKLIRKLYANIDNGYFVSGLISTNGAHTGRVVNGVPVLGGVDTLNSVIREKNIQEVIFSTQQLSYEQVLGIIARSGKQRVNFKLIPSNLDVIIGKASIDRIDDVPLLEIDYKLHQRRYQFLKRLFDLTLSCGLAIFTFPSYLYKKYVLSKRLIQRQFVGANGKTLTLYEFEGKSSSILNKIPYIWSVIKGDLTFVGTALQPANKNDTEGTGVELKPGLTGLVQINRDKELAAEDITKYQLYYLKNYSPLLDLEILFKAIFKIR